MNSIKSNHLIAQGSTDSSFIFTTRDESALTYFFVYYYLWADNRKSVIDRAMLYDHRLHVELQQPAEVYPGEECESKIRVTDYEGNPVPNVNLMASAINGQFENFDLPAIPEFSKSHGNFKSRNDYSMRKVEMEETIYPDIRASFNPLDEKNETGLFAVLSACLYRF